MTISYLAPRRSLIEKFSNFLVIEESRNENRPYLNCQWQKDVKLAQNIAKNQANLPENESQCFLYWLEKADNNFYAKSHSIAYLQSSCYWAVKEFFAKVKIENNNISPIRYYLTAFDTVIEKTSNLSQLTAKFSKFNDKYSNVNTYTQKWLTNVVYDTIYQAYGFGKYTQWGLLRNTTKKTLQTALFQQGYHHDMIAWYVMIWDSFQAIYNENKPSVNNKKLTSPTIQQINDIIKLSQSLALQVSPMSSEFMKKLTPTNFEQIMKQCHQAVNMYQQQKHINAYAYSFTCQEIAQAHNNDNVFTEADLFQNFNREEIKQENNTLLSHFDRSEINLMLKNQLRNIDNQQKVIFTLNYGLGLNQSNIASILGYTQPIISKKIKSTNRLFLTNFIKEINKQSSQKTLDDSLQKKLKEIKINSQQVSDVKEFIDSWLSDFYQKDLYYQLENSFLQLSLETQQIFTFFYGGFFHLKSRDTLKLSQQEKVTQIVQITNKKEKEIKQEINQSKLNLQHKLIEYVNQKYNLNIPDNNREISKLIEQWCYEAPYAKWL